MVVKDSPWEVTLGQMSSMCLIKQIWGEQQPSYSPCQAFPAHPEWATAEMFTCEEQQEERDNNNYQFSFLARMIPEQ